MRTRVLVPGRSCTSSTPSTRTRSASPNVGVPNPPGVGTRPICPSERYRAGASTCSASACMPSRAATNESGSGSSTARTLEQVFENLRKLQRFVSLDAVTGAGDDDDPRLRVPPRQFGDIFVVDHRRRSAPNEEERHLDALHGVPQLVEAGNDLALLALTGTATRKVVAPTPSAVADLDRVVENAAAQ